MGDTMAVWVRCKAGECHFRTPDGKESDKLPPPRRKGGNPPSFVYDALSDPKKKCAENCRCYIIVQTIEKKTNAVLVEQLYPADGNAEGALTKDTLDQKKKDAENMKTQKIEVIAACIEMVVQEGKLEPKRV